MKNKIICGDCLEVLKKIESETVDLIYLDPPFSSNKNYTGIWDKTKEELSFDDSHWDEGVKGYIKWLRERVDQCFRVLKPTGSLYLHCDWHASHYIKVMLDEFTKKYDSKFQNEIIWYYKGRGMQKNRFQRKHDIIFFYSKSKKFNFYGDNILVPLDPKHISRYNKTDKDGKKYALIKKKNSNSYSKIYLKDGIIPTDVWDIPFIHGKESIGYPTQKPEKLLERIIKAASNNGDIVLDPFCGCGTTLSVSAQLGRKFIGIDEIRMAIKVMDNRLREIRNWTESRYLSAKVDIRPFEWETIFPGGINNIKKYNWRNFQDWVCEKLGAIKGKRGPDGGIDGTTTTNVAIYDVIEKRLIALPPETLIQSKHFSKAKVGEPYLKKFESTIRQKNKIEGIMVSWEFAKTTKQYVSEAKERGISIYCVKAEWLHKQPTPTSPYADSYKVNRKKFRLDDYRI